MANWINDPQNREDIEKVTEKLKLPLYKPSAKGKFRDWLRESWNRLEDYLLGLKKNVDGKEPAFDKNTAFNKNFGTTAGTVLEGKKLEEINNNIDGKVSKVGDTMTGNLIIDKNKALITFLDSVGQDKGGYIGFPTTKHLYIHNYNENGNTYITARNLNTNSKEIVEAINEVNTSKITLEKADGSSGEGFTNGGAGLFVGWGNEFNFRSSGSGLYLNYRALDETKISKFYFYAGDKASYGSIYAGNIYSNNNEVWHSGNFNPDSKLSINHDDNFNHRAGLSFIYANSYPNLPTGLGHIAPMIFNLNYNSSWRNQILMDFNGQMWIRGNDASKNVETEWRRVLTTGNRNKGSRVIYNTTNGASVVNINTSEYSNIIVSAINYNGNECTGVVPAIAGTYLLGSSVGDSGNDYYGVRVETNRVTIAYVKNFSNKFTKVIGIY